jgi:hypothetical protein
MLVSSPVPPCRSPWNESLPCCAFRPQGRAPVAAVRHGYAMPMSIAPKE